MELNPTLEQQVQIVIRALEGRKFRRDVDAPTFKKALEWIENWPTAIRNTELRQKLLKAISLAFSVTEAEIYSLLEGVDRGLPLLKPPPNGEEILRTLLPKGGWFEWYDKYTEFNEAPLSFHVFSSMCILSAVLGRQVFIDMGFFKVFPTCSVVLVGPPGKVKKTLATDIALDMVRKLAPCPILPDKITPERLATSLAKSGHQFLCAEELCFFFGKQKYNEGLVPIMLKVLSGRSTIEVETQARELEVVQNISVTFLGGSTPSLLASAVPADVISSGFLSRLLLVHEQDTCRKFAVARVGPCEGKLLDTANRLKGMTGTITLTPAAEKWHSDWYDKNWAELRGSMDEIESDMKSRTQIHMLRLAMLIHLAQCDNFKLCEECLQVSAGLIRYLEQGAPKVVRQLKQTAISNDTDYLLANLEKLGGAATHSRLLRRVSSRMTAQQFKQHIRTLEESGRIKVGKRGIGTHYVVVGLEETDEVE